MNSKKEYVIKYTYADGKTFYSKNLMTYEKAKAIASSGSLIAKLIIRRIKTC